MAAISQDYPPGEAAVRALAAGADVALLVDGAEEVHQAIVSAVRSGQLPREQFEESVRRVVRLKLQYRDRWATPPPLSVVGTAAHQALAATIGQRAATLVRDHTGVLPLRPGSRLLLVRPSVLPGGEDGPRGGAPAGWSGQRPGSRR
ncbi:MAG: hypothetical protein KatS3mg061_3018 [Dehalococcoidia bacterium]|nr:MAG: hypothetical protein KatS3mg061_3018 [Dehalococcoidia bacterium]